MNNEMKIAVLGGDGIGPECMTEALRVLEVIGNNAKLNIGLEFGEVGGCAFEKYGEHFPDSTFQVCKRADAILFGSVGGPISEAQLPKWKNCETNSILALRKRFSFNANWRPVRLYPALFRSSPLKAELLKEAVDLLVIRELNGDIYFGEHSRSKRDNIVVAKDVAEYSEEQIYSVAKIAFRAAERRKCKLTSVDKANVLETSKLWREVVHSLSQEFPSVFLEDMLVDNCAMQLVLNPAQFDVILASNMFGDILSDIAAALPGSLGLMASASFNSEGFALYEPAGGSAPAIAGLGIANPIAQILCVAQMLRYSFERDDLAYQIEHAVEMTLNDGYRTKDIYSPSDTLVGTTGMTDMIIAKLNNSLSATS